MKRKRKEKGSKEKKGLVDVRCQFLQDSPECLGLSRRWRWEEKSSCDEGGQLSKKLLLSQLLNC